MAPFCLIQVKLRVFNDFDDRITFFLGPIHIQQHETTQYTGFHLRHHEFLFHGGQRLAMSTEIPGGKQLLGLLPRFPVNDGRVVIFPVILRQDVSVLNGFMRQIVFGIGLLVQHVTAILLV